MDFRIDHNWTNPIRPYQAVATYWNFSHLFSFNPITSPIPILAYPKHSKVFQNFYPILFYAKWKRPRFDVVNN